MLNDNCSVCGLPKDLCVCVGVQKQASVLSIKIERRKYGKLWAKIDGIDSSQNMKDIVKKLKNKLACGGTFKKNSIEILFGKHERTKELIGCLEEFGYNKESIKVTKE